MTAIVENIEYFPFLFLVLLVSFGVIAEHLDNPIKIVILDHADYSFCTLQGF
jgi:hypothetical protein